MTIAVAHSETARGRAALHKAAAEAVAHDEPLAVLCITGEKDESPSTTTLTERVAAELKQFPGLGWEIRIRPEVFDIGEALLALADDVGASMLVIGSRRRTPVGKLFLGSVVQEVLLTSQIPVLVVKAA